MEDPRIENQDIETGGKKKITISEVSEAKKHLMTKSAMLLVAAVIVVVVLAVLGIAWYTRVANSYSVTFSVADYDLAINKHSDEEFLLNVYDYSQVTSKHFAPGTVGWMPLEISAEYSNVDVQFSISMTNNMPDEIKGHYRLFVLYSDSTTDPSTGVVKYNYIYGDAMATEASIAGYNKRYLDSDSVVIDDTITAGTKKTLCVYWEWYLDADRANEDHTETAGGVKTFKFYKADGTKAIWTVLTDEEKAGVRTRWDNLDTDIGRYPAKYKDSMMFVINTTGAQVKPSDGTKITTTAAQTP